MKELRQKIEYKKIEDIIPYENNPRINDEASKKVAESIEQFGFRNPIILDKDGVIIAGHTRLKAAISLGYKEVPVIYASDLSETQAKAFRIADNRVGEFAEWNFDALMEEMDSISDEFSYEDLGFGDLMDMADELEESTSEQDNQSSGLEMQEGFQWKSNGEYFDNKYNLSFFKDYRVIAPYDIPIVEAQDIELPERFIAFHNMNWEENSRGLDPSVTGVRFFENDSVEDRFWNNMGYWIERLKKYKCVVAPDFSTYYEMPMQVALFNLWRTFLCAQALQDAGIPTILPCRTLYDWKYGQFVNEWFPKNAYYAISTKGSMRDDWDMDNIRQSLDGIYENMNPKAVLIFGTDVPDYEFNDTDKKHYVFDNDQF